jgi:arylsulfatase A-like enzyme
MNGQRTNFDTFDAAQQTFPKLLQKAGYTTAIIGKWHLKTNPTGFDEWMIYPGQGYYYSPEYITPTGKKKIKGYSVEVTTNLALDFLKRNKDGKPFLLMCQFKAPHRNWMPGPKYLHMYDDVTIPEPETLFDDYKGREKPASRHRMGIDNDMTFFYDLKVPQIHGRYDGMMKAYMHRLTPKQLAAWKEAYDPKNKAFMDAHLEGKDLVRWKYQRYVKDYLRCVAAVDDNIGRILDYLHETGLDKNTIVVYSSDQGFYLGEHGWFDKRWMYEESFRMPLLMRWPGKIKPGTKIDKLTQNIDFAPTLLEAAGVNIPKDIQGESLLPLVTGKKVEWRKSLYYHYYEEGGGHGVTRQYGVRTDNYKLIRYYAYNKWELFDMKKDPHELKSVYNNPEYMEIKKRLKDELARLEALYKIKEEDDKP